MTFLQFGQKKRFVQQQQFKFFKTLKKMSFINLKNKYKNNSFIADNKNDDANNNENDTFFKKSVKLKVKLN